MDTIVRKIDHVYAPLDDASAAHAFLTGTLGLPEVWPPMKTARSWSGGVSFGNVNVESLQGNDLVPAERPARVSGIAFEPVDGIDELVAALDERGIGRTEPTTYTWQNGTPAWTVVRVDVSIGTFFCKYHFDPPRKVHELSETEGGPLGIVRIAGLVIGATDHARAVARWQVMLDPIERTGDAWAIGAGPCVRLVPSDGDRIEHLVLDVRSVGKALAAASELGIAVEDETTLVPQELGGLRLVLR